MSPRPSNLIWVMPAKEARSLELTVGVSHPGPASFAERPAPRLWAVKSHNDISIAGLSDART